MPRSCVPLRARPRRLAVRLEPATAASFSRLAKPDRGDHPAHPDQPHHPRQPRPHNPCRLVTGNPLVLLWVVFRDGPGCLVWCSRDSTRSSSFPHLGGCIRFGHLQLVPIPTDACAFRLVLFSVGSRVGIAGFEPAASRSQSERATRLRYIPLGWLFCLSGVGGVWFVLLFFFSMKLTNDALFPSRRLARGEVYSYRLRLPVREVVAVLRSDTVASVCWCIKSLLLMRVVGSSLNC